MKGDGVVVLRSGLVVFQRVRLVHEHQVVLLGHHVRAHRLLVATAVLGEGELVGVELGFLCARGHVSGAHSWPQRFFGRARTVQGSAPATGASAVELLLSAEQQVLQAQCSPRLSRRAAWRVDAASRCARSS